MQFRLRAKRDGGSGQIGAFNNTGGPKSGGSTKLTCVFAIEPGDPTIPMHTLMDLSRIRGSGSGLSGVVGRMSSCLHLSATISVFRLKRILFLRREQ